MSDLTTGKWGIRPRVSDAVGSNYQEYVLALAGDIFGLCIRSRSDSVLAMPTNTCKLCKHSNTCATQESEIR
jgi:hypothetical protein